MGGGGREGGGLGAPGPHLRGREPGQARLEQRLLALQELPALVLRVAKGQAQNVVRDEVLAEALVAVQAFGQVLAGAVQGQLVQLVRLEAPRARLLNVAQD